MGIIYSDHAKKRMKQRGIEDWEVEQNVKQSFCEAKIWENFVALRA